MSAVEQRSRPFFLVTIDTEGDNLWSAPKEITTRNSRFLPRFQETCERFGVRPTYLTNYEMLHCQAFREFATDVLRRGKAEVGMHLHAWNNPPIEPLTSDDFANLPYLVEYPDRIMGEKIHVLTAELEQTFGVKMLSHRAGRWNIDGRYIGFLIDEGYLIDCTVTPGVSWRPYKGNPEGDGGADYSGFPSDAYWIDPADISKASSSDFRLLEVPVTVLEAGGSSLLHSSLNLLRGLRAVGFRGNGNVREHRPAPCWLRPTGRNRRQLLRTLQRVRAEQRRYAEFMLHSSELMPGGSPTFTTEASIERLYDDLDALFSEASRSCVPATMTEFHQDFVTNSQGF